MVSKITKCRTKLVEAWEDANLSSWLRYVAERLSWQQGHLDESSWFAFLRANTLGVDPRLAIGVVARIIDRAGDSIKADKLVRQIARAYGWEIPAGTDRKVRSQGDVPVRPATKAEPL